MKKEKDEIFNCQFYEIVEEYCHKPKFAPPFSLFIYIIYAFYMIFNGLSKLISIHKDKFNIKNSVIPSEQDRSEVSLGCLPKCFLFKLILNLIGGAEIYG